MGYSLPGHLGGKKRSLVASAKKENIISIETFQLKLLKILYFLQKKTQKKKRNIRVIEKERQHE